MSGNPIALKLEDALQVDEARRACQIIAQQRRAARDELTRAIDRLAAAEKLYRQARAVAYVHNAECKTAGERDAKVDSDTSDRRYDRDVARGLVQACEERLKEIDAERASLHRLIDWSAAIDPYASQGQRESIVRAA